MGGTMRFVAMRTPRTDPPDWNDSSPFWAMPEFVEIAAVEELASIVVPPDTKPIGYPYDRVWSRSGGPMP